MLHQIMDTYAENEASKARRLVEGHNAHDPEAIARRLSPVADVKRLLERARR